MAGKWATYQSCSTKRPINTKILEEKRERQSQGFHSCQWIIITEAWLSPLWRSTGSPFRKTEFTTTKKSDEKIEVNIIFIIFICKACNFLWCNQFSSKPSYKYKYGTHLALDIIMDFAKKKSKQTWSSILLIEIRKPLLKKFQIAKNVTKVCCLNSFREERRLTF